MLGLPSSLVPLDGELPLVGENADCGFRLLWHSVPISSKV